MAPSKRWIRKASRTSTASVPPTAPRHRLAPTPSAAAAAFCTRLRLSFEAPGRAFGPRAAEGGERGQSRRRAARRASPPRYRARRRASRDRAGAAAPARRSCPRPGSARRRGGRAGGPAPGRLRSPTTSRITPRMRSCRRMSAGGSPWASRSKKSLLSSCSSLATPTQKPSTASTARPVLLRPARSRSRGRAGRRRGAARSLHASPRRARRTAAGAAPARRPSRRPAPRSRSRSACPRRARSRRVPSTATRRRRGRTRRCRPGRTASAIATPTIRASIVRVLEVEHGRRTDAARGAGDVGRDDHRHRLPVGRLRRPEDQVQAGVGERVADRAPSGARQHVAARRERPVAPVGQHAAAGEERPDVDLARTGVATEPSASSWASMNASLSGSASWMPSTRRPRSRGTRAVERDLLPAHAAERQQRDPSAPIRDDDPARARRRRAAVRAARASRSRPGSARRAAAARPAPTASARSPTAGVRRSRSASASAETRRPAGRGRSARAPPCPRRASSRSAARPGSMGSRRRTRVGRERRSVERQHELRALARPCSRAGPGSRPGRRRRGRALRGRRPRRAPGRARP